MKEDIQYNSKGEMYLRKSMVETFMFCPMRFKLEYINKLEINQNTYMMDVGTRFHEFACWFFNVYQSFEPDQWVELVPNVFTAEEKEMALWFIEQEYLRWTNNPDLFMPVMREMKIIDHELCLSGTFDRLDRITHNDEMAIVEYKTGRSYNKQSIERQLAFYKLLWDRNMGKGNITHMRYINPRLRKYELVPLRQNVVDKVLLDIAHIRKCIREDTFNRSCTPVKYIICHLCDIDECGAFDYAKRS